MSTNAGAITNVTLQKLVDAIIASITYPDGSHPAAAPNAWKHEGTGRQLDSTDTVQFNVEVRINPDGSSAWGRVTPIGSRASSLEGQLDLTVLATKLV